MTRRCENLGLWFAGSYVVILSLAFVFPEDRWYPFGVFIKMIPGTLLWPFVITFERFEIDSSFAWCVLYLVVGPLCFWCIGKIVSIATDRLLPFHDGQKG